MLIATSISTKGGVGKTTSLLGMAMVAAADGKKAVLIDTDGNEPMGEFQTAGQQNGYWTDDISVVSIFNEDGTQKDLPKMVEDFETNGMEYVFIDTKGGEGDFLAMIAQLADVIIVPSGLSKADVDGAENTFIWLQQLEEAGLEIAPYFALISQMPPSSKMGKTNAHMLGELEENFPLFDIRLPVNSLTQNMMLYGLFHKVIEELKVAELQSDRLQARNFANAMTPFRALLNEASSKART